MAGPNGCSTQRLGRILSMLLVLAIPAGDALAQPELSQRRILNAIELGRRHLISEQQADGSWDVPELGTYKTGVTGLALLALINAGADIKSEPVQKGLRYLRSIRNPKGTYDISMMLMAFAAARDSAADVSRIHTLAALLEQGQIKQGSGAGCWGYSVDRVAIDRGDRSNGQLAVLALRDAAEAGAPISQQTWELARSHWLKAQNASDGGWGYSLDDRRSIGSMTVAGIATLVITSSMIRDETEVDANGRPNCCDPIDNDEALEKALGWLEKNFSVRQNPLNGRWFLYYIYGLERAGRLSGRRLFGQFDWYREGASYLLNIQLARGSWKGVGPGESHPVVGTSFALLFLSKGLSPVLVNKLKFGPRAPNRPGDVLDDDWNRHPQDARNLTKLISGLPRWPRLVTAQNVDLDRLPAQGGAAVLKQAPILLLTGSNNPRALLRDDQVELLREYLDRGGFIFAVRNCASADFEDGLRQLVQDLYPNGEASLQKLPVDHPVYRAEYPLDPDQVELLGVDAGCRTTIIYSPDDIGCLWNKWMRVDPPSRPNSLKIQITRATRIGINVVAYVTGREPPLRITDDNDVLDNAGELDRVERGFLKIAKLRHSGGWDTAPRAVKNLLIALNQTAGVETSTVTRNLFAADKNLIRYPLIYMHGRHPFFFNKQERDQIEQYLQRGGVLFADACCGSRLFDDSFRQFCEQLFPQQPLKRIPVDHPLFDRPAGFGHSIRQVTRRIAAGAGDDQALEALTETGEPFLEGIEIDGRLAIIYSKYDISCALERQASVACSGYVFDDAVKLAVNTVLYAMTQDIRFRPWLDAPPDIE